MTSTIEKSQEDIFQTVSMSSPASMYIMQDGKFVFANPRFFDRVGFTKDELLNTDPYDLIHPEDREIARQNAIEMLKGIRTTPYEYRAFNKAGEMMWVAETVASIQYQGKRAVLASALNITEQKQAEETLKANKELIDNILARIPDAVLVVGRDSNVILANTAFYDAFGMNKRNVVGRPVCELIHAPHLLESILKILLDQEPQINLEFKQELKGNKKTLVVTIMKMGEKGALLILDDVTEERQKQERLFLTDRLSSIGEMSAGVAHELNNPLTGIVSLSQLLLESNPPDELREDITDIHNEAQRAASIVKNLLTFSRKHAPVREPTQLNRVIEDVIRLRAYEHKVNNIDVRTHLAPDLPEVVVDYHQMQQVFLNIVLNAESAMAEVHNPGSLTVTTRRLNNHVIVSFSDDGPGIPQENLNRLFDPFFTTKEVGKGTGLGLSICYGIVTQHGGKIHAQNRAGKGATFVVELPIESQQAMEKSYEKQ
jgi:PAS domain S-box-containing protein